MLRFGASASWDLETVDLGLGVGTEPLGPGKNGATVAHFYVAAQNGSDSQWEGLLTLCIVDTCCPLLPMLLGPSLVSFSSERDETEWPY